MFTNKLKRRFDEAIWNPDESDRPKLIGAYSIDRRFGGHEEGGWWYDWYEHLESREISPEADLLETAQELYSAHASGDADRPLSSVLSTGIVMVLVEKTSGDRASTERPHYE